MKRTLLSTLVLIASLAGCSSTQTVPDEQIQNFTGAKPAGLARHFHKLYVEGERNAVLNLNSLAMAALAAREFEVAGKALDKSIARIEAVYADDPRAEAARGLWREESSKDFKGEPYERAMTYFYRGLLYLRDGDYQNARAMFLGADFQDTVAENEAFRADFGLMNYLAAWASHCDGDPVRAKGLLEQAARSEPTAWGSARLDGDWLLLVESGSGPVKASSGRHGEILEIKAPTDQPAPPRLTSASGVEPHLPDLRIGADVLFQATTRGGREVQAILDGKAEFKDDAQNLGLASTVAAQQALNSAAYSNNRDMLNIGGAFALISIASSIASMSTQPAADTRAWSPLPSRIDWAGGRLLAAGRPAQVRVSLTGSDGIERSFEPAFSSVAGRCGLTVVMAREPVSGSAEIIEAAPLDRQDTDDLFRTELERDFGAGLTRSARL